MTFNFKKELINILIGHIQSNCLGSFYNLDVNRKYTLDHIVEIVIQISKKKSAKYKMPENLSAYLNKPSYKTFSVSSIKAMLNNQHYSAINDAFIKTYVIIGHDIAISVKELTVYI